MLLRRPRLVTGDAGEVGRPAVRFGFLRTPRLRNKLFVVGLVLVTAAVVVAVFAPVIAPSDPLAQDSAAILRPPGTHHFMGTDSYGRDVFTRVVRGSRVSLVIGLAAVALSCALGTAIGLMSAFGGGIVDAVVARLIDVLLSFPVIVVAITIVAIVSPGTGSVILALGFSLSPKFARVVRAEVLSVRELEFIEAARASGARNSRILVRHILRNIIAPLIVMVTLYLPYAILIEASLSFLGVGVSPDTTTWGLIISDGREYLELAWWITVFPGLAISFTVLGFNLLGDGLRDILDPTVES